MDFDLSEKQLDLLLTQPCEYCGAIAGTVDRRDNSVGYVYSNCAPACRRCNSFKGHYLTHAQMMQVVKMLGWRA